MQPWWVVFACAACGRIGFDPVGGASTDGAPSDGPNAKPHYVTQASMGNFNQLLTLDVTTGELTLVRDLPVGAGELDGLVAFDATTLFASSYDGRLTRIELDSNVVNTIVDPLAGQLVGIDNDTGAIAYAIEESNNALCRVTLPTFDRTCQGFTTFTALGGDIAHAPDGRWYAWSNAQMSLFTVDVDTAVATPVEPGELMVEELTGLVFGPDGVLRAIARSSNELIEIDHDTGVFTKRTTLCLRNDCPTEFPLEFGDLAIGR